MIEADVVTTCILTILAEEAGNDFSNLVLYYLYVYTYISCLLLAATVKRHSSSAKGERNGEEGFLET